MDVMNREGLRFFLVSKFSAYGNTKLLVVEN